MAHGTLWGRCTRVFCVKVLPSFMPNFITTCQSLHCVPVKLVLGDAPAKPQPHPGHTLRPRRLVERCVGLPPRLPTALRRRLPGGQLAGSQALKGEEEKA